MSDAPPVPDWAGALPLARGVRVAAVGAGGLLALEKPPGLMSHPNNSSDKHFSLLAAEYDHRHERYHWTPTAPDQPGQLFLLNRLDSPTSGLVLAALEEETAKTVRRALAEGGVQKRYFALVRNRPRPNKGVWTDRLARAAPAQRGVRVQTVRQLGQLAKVNYECVESHVYAGALITLLKLEPLTGRTHQLRVQCATRGFPIVGDGTYGDFQFNREFARRTGHKRMFLHAAALRLPTLGFSAESPLSREFHAAMGKGHDRKPDAGQKPPA
jgi:tRNA pseudouridine65 synthase